MGSRSVTSEERIDEPRYVKDLLEYPGSLCSAKAKADLAYALGWIGPQVKGDLDTIRTIRNKFAHSHAVLTFDNAGVGQLFQSIKALEFAGVRLKYHRDQFLFAVLALTLQLAELYGSTSRPPKGTDTPVRPVL